MRIGIDARPLAASSGGIRRVTRCLVQALEQIDSRNDYFLYASRDFDLPFKNPRWQKRLAHYHVPGTLWLQSWGRRMIRQEGLDLFLGTAQFLPLGLPSVLGKLLIVHDLVWKLFPETVAIRNLVIQRVYSKHSVEAADLIIAVSESTKRDLQKFWGTKAEKIRVIHNGVSPDFYPHDPKSAANYLAGKYGTTRNYICAVGTLEPRKNLVRLIEAFAILKRRNGFPCQLVIAGPKGWGNLRLQKKAEASGLTERDLRFLGFVPDPDLPLLYSGASAFVFPSLYEGFGLPLLEAMACGTPVACSNRSSLPEIGADAVLYFNPESAEEIAGVVEKILIDPALRQRLIQRGLERVRLFSWDSCAKSILSALNEAARTQTPPPHRDSSRSTMTPCFL